MDYLGKARWLKTREKGYRKYILINGVVYWGATMLLLMTFIFNNPFQEGFALGLLVVYVFIFTITGIAYGIMSWSINEKRLKNSGYSEGET